MGLGGELIWTPVIRRLYEFHGKPIALYARPALSDLLVGAWHDRSKNRSISKIFENNPYVKPDKHITKSSLARHIDRWFEKALVFTRLKTAYDGFWYWISQKASFRFIYLDLIQHSYAERELKDRFIWRAPGHSIDIIARSVAIKDTVPHQLELFFERSETEKIRSLVNAYELSSFIVIEPCSSADYFGNLRAWPFERWQAVVDQLKLCFPAMKVIQVSLEGSPLLSGCLNLCGQLTFRETAALIKMSSLFLGTDGGLMHAANSVDAKAVIVWGGVTDPEFLGYPESHRIVCLHVPCAPCGLKGNCPNGHICMLNISVDQVMGAVVSELEAVMGKKSVR
ncbi:MAG: hypothetical protein JXB42_07045 [Deltaproteobacteria bacterium]|nr:hypothetical protein [Deltaproteobacteria bacterium]